MLTPPTCFMRQWVSPVFVLLTQADPLEYATRCCLLQLYICNRGIAPLDTLNPVLVDSKRIFFLTEGDPLEYGKRCCLLQLYICKRGIAPLDTLNPVLVE